MHPAVHAEQPQQGAGVDVDHRAYTYEDHLADFQAAMGNSHSSESSSEAPRPPDMEATAIGRQQAVTGAKAATTESQPKARGPMAKSEDFEFLQVSGVLGSSQVILGLL